MAGLLIERQTMADTSKINTVATFAILHNIRGEFGVSKSEAGRSGAEDELCLWPPPGEVFCSCAYCAAASRSSD